MSILSQNTQILSLYSPSSLFFPSPASNPSTKHSRTLRDPLAAFPVAKGVSYALLRGLLGERSRLRPSFALIAAKLPQNLVLQRFGNSSLALRSFHSSSLLLFASRSQGSNHLELAIMEIFFREMRLRTGNLGGTIVHKNFSASLFP